MRTYLLGGSRVGGGGGGGGGGRGHAQRKEKHGVKPKACTRHDSHWKGGNQINGGKSTHEHRKCLLEPPIRRGKGVGEDEKEGNKKGQKEKIKKLTN